MKNLYCIPTLDRLGEYTAFAEEYQAGFEYNEFFIPAILDDEVAKKQIIKNIWIQAGTARRIRFMGHFLMCASTVQT